MRGAIFTLLGAVLLATTTFIYGMIFLDGATQEPAFRLVIGGTLLGGFLGLLVAAISRPSGTPRLIVLGAVGGLLAGFVYGVIGLKEGTCDHGFCGWVFLGRLFDYPWMPIALWTVFGGVTGALLAWTAARLTQEKRAASRASGGLA